MRNDDVACLDVAEFALRSRQPIYKLPQGTRILNRERGDGKVKQKRSPRGTRVLPSAVGKRSIIMERSDRQLQGNEYTTLVVVKV